MRAARAAGSQQDATRAAAMPNTSPMPRRTAPAQKSNPQDFPCDTRLHCERRPYGRVRLKASPSVWPANVIRRSTFHQPAQA